MSLLGITAFTLPISKLSYFPKGCLCFWFPPYFRPKAYDLQSTRPARPISGYTVSEPLPFSKHLRVFTYKIITADALFTEIRYGKRESACPRRFHRKIVIIRVDKRQSLRSHGQCKRLSMGQGKSEFPDTGSHLIASRTAGVLA